MTADRLLRGMLEGVEMVLQQPVARKAIRCADPQMIAFDREQPAGTDPGIEDGGRQFVGERIEQPRPKASQH